MKIKLIFEDWRSRRTGFTIYQTEMGVELGMGPFHSGTTFDAEIILDAAEAAELEIDMRHGYDPIFKVALP